MRGRQEAPRSPPGPSVLCESLAPVQGGPAPLPCLFLPHSILSLPPPEAPKANSSLISCPALSVCTSALSPVNLGLYPSLPLSCSLSSLVLFQSQSWLPWQRCSGYQVAVGGREPALPQPPPFPMPGTHEVHWLRIILGGTHGLPRPQRLLTDLWEVGNGEGQAWE